MIQDHGICHSNVQPKFVECMLFKDVDAQFSCSVPVPDLYDAGKTLSFPLNKSVKNKTVQSNSIMGTAKVCSLMIKRFAC